MCKGLDGDCVRPLATCLAAAARDARASFRRVAAATLPKGTCPALRAVCWAHVSAVAEPLVRRTMWRSPLRRLRETAMDTGASEKLLVRFSLETYELRMRWCAG